MSIYINNNVVLKSEIENAVTYMFHSGLNGMLFDIRNEDGDVDSLLMTVSETIDSFISVYSCRLDVFDCSDVVPYGVANNPTAINTLISAFQKQGYIIINKSIERLKVIAENILFIRDLAYLSASRSLACDIASLDFRNPDVAANIHLFLEDVFTIPDNITHFSFGSIVEKFVCFAKVESHYVAPELTKENLRAQVSSLDAVLTPNVCITLLEHFTKLFYHPCNEKNKAFVGFSDYAFFFDDDVDLMYIKSIFG